MGVHCTEEITFDVETGRKKSRKKHQENARKTEDEEAHPDGEEEELKEGESKKIREKYTLPQVKVPHECTVCEGPLVMGGPIWNREIHDVEFVKRLLESARANQAGENGHKVQTTERIQAILSAIIDESILGQVPLSYELSNISSTFKVANPRKGQLVAAFNSLDYMLTQTYYEAKLFKTNAPPDVIYDIFKQWKNKTYDND